MEDIVGEKLTCLEDLETVEDRASENSEHSLSRGDGIVVSDV